MEPRLVSVLRKVRTAEIQAIAIYEAETFFIRAEKRRAFLREILAEEREHDEALAAAAPLGRFTLTLNRAAGRVLGTVLAFLPWKWMCRVQAWAETEAALIYERGADDLIRGQAPAALVASLRRAGEQERRHAERFRALRS